MDSFCKLSSALPRPGARDGLEHGYAPCNEISKVWSSKRQYCKLQASSSLHLWPWWLTNKVGCVSECKTSPGWMGQIPCCVLHVACEHHSQHPALPKRPWCLLFAKATHRNVLQQGLHPKPVAFLWQDYNYCSVLFPLLFTNDKH